MPEQSADLADEGKAVSAEFLHALGLQDIIAGGLAAYLIWLPRQSSLSDALPQIGKPYLDVPLLICAAAILGKLIGLVVAFLTAVSSILLRRSKTHQTLVTEVVRCDELAKLKTRAQPERGTTAPALALVQRAWPARLADLRAIANNSAFAYTCAVIALLVPLTTLAHLGVWSGSKWVAAAVFFILGLLWQQDYEGELARTLSLVRADDFKGPPANDGTSAAARA